MTRVSSVSALALMALSQPAFADVTAQQAWDNLQAYMQGFGYTVTATATASGDGLAVTGISVAVPIPEDESTLTMGLPDLTYTDKGDGSVDVTIPESAPMTIAFAEDGKPAEGLVTVMMTQSGLSMNISGTPEEMVYTYTAETLGLTLDSIKDGETMLPPDVVRGSVSMGPLDGSSKVSTSGGVVTIAQEMSYGDLAYDFAFNDPEDQASHGALKGSLKGLSAAGSTSMPEGANFEDPAAVFAAGLAVDATMTHMGGSTEFDFQDGSDIVKGTLSSTGGELGFAMSQDSLSYALSAMGQTVSMMVPDMPFPIEAKFGEAGFNMEMPLSASEEPQPASLSILLSEFTMADMLWGIFDPGQVLPRDPATIGVTVDAEVTPFVNLMDPEDMASVEAGETLPGELNSLTISELVVQAIGARIAGSGDFTFDNEDLESFDGMPRPEGVLNLEISGVNGVIDKLIQMGIVQEQDAMGARMMLGMFTVPGSAPDTATSKIEVNAEGQVLANGQRIK